MKRSTVLPAIAAAAALSLSACNGESAPTATTEEGAASPTAAASTSAPAETGSDSSESDGSTSSPSESAGADDKATTVPESAREDSKDTSSLPAEQGKIPSGPATSISIKKLGGYAKHEGDHAALYAVLEVDSSERGWLDIEYVLLDKSGKTVKTVKDNIPLAGTKGELKVTRASSSIPRGQVERVRLRVTRNAPNEFATVTMIDPKITSAPDPDTKTPVVKGRYKTDGKGGAGTLTAVCSDSAGKVIVGWGVPDSRHAKSWTPYEVNLLDAPKGYTPTKCYVGS